MSKITLRKIIASTPLLRPFAISVIRLLKKDIVIKNPWSGMPLKINSYRHKGYWYFKAEREEQTMNMFARLVKEGDTVIEVGGHIGFITQYFSKLVGSEGRVVVFEPGLNNRGYIKENVAVLSNARLECVAVSSRDGKSVFHEDNITGQNNSLMANYRNAKIVADSHGEKLKITEREVEVVALDTYIRNHCIVPNFIKIDVEGLERDVLIGAKVALSSVRAIMVEVTEENESVARILIEAGFDLFDEGGRRIEGAVLDGNVFAIRSSG